MIIRHTLSVALLTALAGFGAPFDAHAQDTLSATPSAEKAKIGKAGALVPHYVRHKAGRQRELQAELLAQGGEIRYYLELVDTYVVNLPEQVALGLRDGKNAKLVERVPEHKLAAQVVPWNIDQFQARDVWDKNRDGTVDVGAPDGSGITICVVDTGFHIGHSDFAGITVNGTTEGSVGTWSTDGNGHGTHVAGTINAVNNDRGVVGVLPGTAELYIVKVFNDSGTWGGGSLAAAADKCRLGGADVISMSLGGGASQTEEDMFQNLYDNFGILNVAAAGNDGNDVPSAPAMYESVVMVAAINEQEIAAEFSQTPPTTLDANNIPANGHWDMVEFSGGGVQVLSTVPTPDGEVPIYRASFGGVDYYGSRIAADAPESTPEGNVNGTLVNGGRCRLADPAQVWTGQVVLCERGDVAFSEKVNRVRAQGGAAVIIYNNIPGDLGATCGPDCDQPSIPALTLSQARGQALLAAGLGQSVNVLIDDGAPCVGCEGGYDFFNGTSMATPGVSGAMAFAWNACGGPTSVTNKQVRQLLRDTAKDLSGTQPADPTVTGDTPIVYGAGYDRVTGWGLVQLADALALGNERFGSTCPLALAVAPTVRDICTLNTTSTTFNLTLDAQFTGTSTASAAGVPAGATGGFSVNPIVNPANTSVYTLSNLAAAPAGVHEIDFSVVDNANANNIGTASVDLTITHALPGTLTLTAPANGATGVSTLPTLTWQAAANATEYLVQVASDAGFTSIVHTANVEGTSHNVSTMLSGDTTYFWRVTPLNGCGTGTAAVASFRTAQSFCATPNLAIPDANTTGVSSTINVPLTGNMTDVDIAVMVSHSWVGDIDARLTHGAQTNRVVINRAGGAGCDTDTLDLTLDDEAAAAIACPPVGTFRPTNALTVFDGTAVDGAWTLNVRDRAGEDTGTFDAWCVIPSVSGGGSNALPVFQNEPYAFSVVQAANNGSPVGSVSATDADAGQTLTYAISGGNTGGAFAINGASGAITVANSAAVIPANGPFSLIVTVNDGVGGLDTSTVTISVTPSGNQAPTVSSPIADQNHAENAVVSLTVAGNFTDANGDTLSFSATGLPGGLSISTAGAITGTLSFTSAGSHNVQVTANDGNGGTVSDTFVWTVSATNRAPTVASPIADQNHAENAVVSLDIAGNFADADSDALSFSATGLPGGLSISPAGAITGTLSFTSAGTHNVQITANDGNGGTVSDTLVWTVSATNRAPTVATPIADQNHAENAAVSLNVAGNFADADGDVLGFTATDLPDGLSISPAGAITGTLSFTSAGSHNVQVTANDGNGGTVSDTLVWTVTATNRAPTITSEPYTFNVIDSAAIGAAVGTVTATDADSDALTYSITAGNTGNAFAINPTTGAITVAADLEGPVQMVLTVRVVDGGGLEDTTSVTINVQPTSMAVFRSSFEG